ncbi:hypothetical protein TcG_08154 [Trypanosoma cruzi]|uniref:Tetraspanin n=1 Tax=Trypanosoma cruzi TaxID=5693 RepID=A0A2V2UWQ3_TRYCR|nr:hypothetical protein BCY84_11011 [Trypanosoma cruzi cruzi]PWU86673.1 hypothetical protein C4B63_113g51 [Trypanosoma cruzi]RNF13897.1 hypothetical protein TcG_08154 [Trypanosoma cruzi]
MHAKLLGVSTPEKGRPQEMDMYVPDEEVDWTSDAYNRLYGERPPQNRYNNCTYHRFSTACFSAFLILLGVAMSAVIAVGGSKSKELNFCHDCKTLILFLLVPGIFFVIMGIVGAASAWRETKLCSALFSLLLVIAAFVVLGTGVTVVIAYTQVVTSDDSLALYWERAVSNTPSRICDLQCWLHCSGFASTHCCVSNVTAERLPDVSPCYLLAEDGVTTLDPNTLQPVSWPSLTCAPRCNSSNIYNATCKEPLQEFFTNLFPLTTGGLFALGLVFLGFASLAVYRITVTGGRTSYLRYEY